MSSKKDSDPDDYTPSFVLFLAFIAIFAALFFPGGFGDRLLIASVPLAVIGGCLKIASAVRHTGRGSAELATAV